MTDGCSMHTCCCVIANRCLSFPIHPTTTTHPTLPYPQALIPEHYQALHACGVQELMRSRSRFACRSGQTIFMCSSNKALVPVRSRWGQVQDRDVHLWIRATCLCVHK